MAENLKQAAAKYHRKTLLDAADRLLMQYGYEGMNMNMLAKEAGYSKATVYVYFSGKDEIVRALCIERLKLLQKEFAVIVKGDMSASDKFEAIKSVLDEFSAEDKAYFDFITASSFTETDADDPGCAELSALIGEIFSQLCALAPAAELKARWFAYYGRIKTGKMFAGGDK